MKKSISLLSAAAMLLGLVFAFTGCEKDREKHEDQKHAEQPANPGDQR
jgi:hypothetical protein